MMKKWAIVIASVWSSASFASNYPVDYCHQTVRVVHDGPALFAHIGSGCDAFEVIGYKLSGYLAASNPSHIDAIVHAHCSGDAKTSVIQLGKEWHGQGYLSEALDYHSIAPTGCQPGTVEMEFAFSAHGAWDSNYSSNYGHFGYGGYNRSDAKIFETHTIGNGTMTIEAWNIVVKEMGQ